MCIQDDPPFQTMPAARQSKLYELLGSWLALLKVSCHTGNYPDFLGYAENYVHPICIHDNARQAGTDCSAKRRHRTTPAAATKRLAGRCATGSRPTSTRSQDCPLDDARAQGSKAIRSGRHIVFRDAQEGWCKGGFKRIHCRYQCLCKGEKTGSLPCIC